MPLPAVPHLALGAQGRRPGGEAVELPVVEDELDRVTALGASAQDHGLGLVLVTRGDEDRRRAHGQQAVDGHGAARGATASDQLEEDHFRGVGLPRSQLQDAGVPAGAVGVARGDLLEQLVDHELVLAEAGHRQAARVVVALLRERDQPLELGLHRLGLRLGGLNALVVDHLAAEVHEQRLAVRRVTRQLPPLLLMPHQPARRFSPRASRVSLTSSIDLRPKLGIAASSDSDFCTRSPTVWMPARFRQLYERTPSSSSSIRMSSIPPAEAPAPSPMPSAPATSAAPWSRRASTRSASVKIARYLMRISAASRSAACGSSDPSVSMSIVSLS